jgi:hypothetical protein
MFNKKSILTALTLVATITLLGFGFRNSYSLQHDPTEDQYKQYVLIFIDKFQQIEDDFPIEFAFDKSNPEKNKKPIDLRLAQLSSYNYTGEVPEKYADVNKQLLETIELYKQNYNTLYEGISTSNSQLVGSSVGNLFGYDQIFKEIEDKLKIED